jgi:hypothetical protein
VWTKGPFLYRNEVLPADGVAKQQPDASGEVKRLGDHPTVTRLQVGGAGVEIATHAEDGPRPRTVQLMTAPGTARHNRSR